MDNNNNKYIIKLYNSIFNNIYIKRIILYHLNIFNVLLSVNIIFKSIEEWDQFKYKEYLYRVTLDFDGYELNKLLDNIKHISIPTPNIKHINQIIKSIPNHIESFKFTNQLYYGHLNSINSSDISSTSLLTRYNQLKFSLTSRQDIKLKIPTSITNLYIYGSFIKIRLIKNALPINLKVLKVDNLDSFEDGCLPESITDASFTQLFDHSIINQLSLNGLVKLKFEGREIESNIRLPNSLQDLTIIKCDSFNTTLPNTLKSFTISMINFKYRIQFPSSLEHINITIRNNLINQEVFQYHHLVPPKLRSLKIPCSSIQDMNGDSILPNQLESLTTCGFNKEIKENQLPSSLTHLILQFPYDQVIDVNVLPSALKILELPFYISSAINPLAIPHQLKLLQILNTQYNHPINLTPSTHPNTIINIYNLNLYYDPSNTDIRMLRLPYNFNSPLSTLHLQDKSNLKYLHLGSLFTKPIQLSDLPINNQIKTLELSLSYPHTINLEYFQNLESIIINNSYINSNQLLKITTTTTTIDNNNNNNNNIIYNNYNLKEIHIPKSNTQFIKQLDINFYKFIIINNTE